MTLLKSTPHWKPCGKRYSHSDAAVMKMALQAATHHPKTNQFRNFVGVTGIIVASYIVCLTGFALMAIFFTLIAFEISIFLGVFVSLLSFAAASAIVGYYMGDFIGREDD